MRGEWDNLLSECESRRRPCGTPSGLVLLLGASPARGRSVENPHPFAIRLRAGSCRKERGKDGAPSRWLRVFLAWLLVTSSFVAAQTRPTPPGPASGSPEQSLGRLEGRCARYGTQGPSTPHSLPEAKGNALVEMTGSYCGVDPEREQWFLRGRMVPGQSAAILRYRAYREKLRLREQVRIRAEGSGRSWEPLGPAPLASELNGDGSMRYNWVSGRATAVAVDPADTSGNTAYAGGAYGGVWKSVNAGPLSQNPASVQWTPLTDDQPTLAVGAIAVQPGGTGVVIAGTGEADSAMDSYYGLGILWSGDGGNTWTLIQSDTSGTHPFAGMGFAQIAFSTSAPNVVAAATAATTEGIAEGLENPISANLGIYGSSNSGNTWTYGNITDNGVAASPGSATAVVYNAAAGMFYAALRYHGFYSSADGINWSRLTNQPGSGLTTTNCPPQTVSPSLCPIYRGEIAALADPNNPSRNELYVWYVDASDNDQGIWASPDGGNTWNQLDEGGITYCGDEFGCGAEQGAYNLALAAVADGTTTDLYAGAVNLYKCTVTGVPLQCFSPFLNLTHVYGCAPNFASIAHVHPAQHSISFLINRQIAEVMYFANDGGIYRALNGYTGLTSETCGTPNAFDSLNQTLGSMTQMVSFAQSTVDPDWILAGTTGNGAAATDSVLISSSWQNANTGDNGYTLIDPTNETNWFTSNPPDSISGVNIFNCGLGMGCDTESFYNDEVVSSSTVGGDTGAYYPPYIFDASGPTQLVVGTCRVWRGPSAGGAYTVLSHSFETGGDGICTGSEINLVRSLAAAIDNNGQSVMYAGTDGYGPLIPTTPPGGHVWMSPNVANGLSSWTDQTGAINPNNFPISGIALDPSDPTAQTAYVAIMGWNTANYPTSQVWQTTNGGATWADFTGTAPNALPSAPADAVLVDSGTVYVGTDVGVFASSTAAPSWSEFGTEAGYLPNAPVTALGLYNDGLDEYLRASTYGRGSWQYPIKITPYYVLSVMPSTMTIFGDQQGNFSGRAIALNSYQGQVTLSCTGTSPPSRCSFSPNPVSPTISGAAFTLTVGGADGAYSFDVQGIDTNGMKFKFPLSLNVVGFALTAPSPNSVSVSIPNTSPSVQFQVKAFGPFNGTVDLACSGLPSGATCNFQPTSAVNPTESSPVNMKLTITTTSSTPSGTFPITIAGTTSGGPQETQSLTLTVTNLADYLLAITPTSQTAAETAKGAQAAFSGTLKASNGYNSPVNLTCVAGATSSPPSCTAYPASLTPAASGAAFTVTVVSNVVASYQFKILATGTDPSAIQHSQEVSFSTTFAFGLINQSGPQSIPAGQTATYTINFVPYGITLPKSVSTFPDSVSMSCLGLPSLSTYSFAPSQVAAGSGQTIVTLSIQTTAPVLARRDPSARRLLFYALWIPLAGLLLAWPNKRKQRGILAVLTLSFLIFILYMGCGGGNGPGNGGSGSPGTPPGEYNVTVSVIMGKQTQTDPLDTLTVN